MQGPKILGFDTSSAHCGAAVFLGNDVVSAAYEDMSRGQAERLFPMIDEVMSEAGLDLGELDALGVGIGPGNFTGIRISVSAARGLALSLGVPAVGVSLFDALAEDAPDAPLLLSLRAARDRYYFQTRHGAVFGDITQGSMEELPQTVDGTVCIGVDCHPIADALGLSAEPAAYAPASAIARIAAQRWETTHERPAPLYVRAADAAPMSDLPPVILPDDA